MAFKLGSINFNAVAQGVGGLVFGNNDQTSQEDDGGVEQLLERIKNGVLVEDRHNAMIELQDIVAESRSAQLAFGATGLPIILAVLREERSDLDLVRGSLETLVNALASEGNFHGSKSQIQPGALNSELLAREQGSAALLLSLLEEEDFYIRYHTLRLLTMLTTSTSIRLQDAVLATPQGITRLMDMMQDREVIRNEALLLLAHLTRSAEEIQKIAVFEGVFEKLFNIIVEEGGSEGGIVVQDCLELLNNIIRSNPSNQSFLRETLGLQPIVSILKLRKSNAHNFSKQKVLNVLCLLETVALLLSQASEELGKDANVVANQTILAQSNLLDYLLVLSVEGRVSAVAVRCEALRCIGDLVHGHSRNCELLGRKVIGDEPDGEPALHSILHVLLHTSELAECIAAEYVIKCFCEQNVEGQIVLASTITPSPESDTIGRVVEAEKCLSFGSMLLKALKLSDDQKDLEASRRAVRVLTHILRDNLDCKEKILQIPLEISGSPLGTPEYLMSRCVRYLASAGKQSQRKSLGSVAGSKIWLQPIFLKLLIVWLADCRAAVSSFLEAPAHLPYMVELLNTADSPVSVHVSGLAAVLLGECVLYNTSIESAHSAHVLVDIISQQVGLSTYFARWEALQNNHVFLMAMTGNAHQKSLTKSSSSEIVLEEESGLLSGNEEVEFETSDVGPVAGVYDTYLIKLIQKLEPIVRDTFVQLFSQPKAKAGLLPSVPDRKGGESESDYINRLKELMQKQTAEMQEIISRNVALAEELVKGGKMDFGTEYTSNLGPLRNPQEVLAAKVETESLHQQIQDLQRRQNEKELESLYYKQLADKFEADLKSLSAAYNSLEQENNRLNIQGSGTRGVLATSLSSVELEAAKEEGRNEARKESEAELNDLLVCLGQEESKVEKLRSRLEELGEDVDLLLQGIGEAEEEDNDDNGDSED